MNEPDLPDMRIGDAEREEAQNALGVHLGAGRLDVDEYSERCAQVATARTRDQLSAVFADLPAPKPSFDAPAERPVPEAAVVVRRPGWRGALDTAAGPIMALSWVAAIFIGAAIRTPWLIGVAFAVSIILGSLTRDGRLQRREYRR